MQHTPWGDRHHPLGENRGCEVGDRRGLATPSAVMSLVSWCRGDGFGVYEVEVVQVGASVCIRRDGYSALWGVISWRWVAAQSPLATTPDGRGLSSRDTTRRSSPERIVHSLDAGMVGGEGMLGYDTNLRNSMT